MTKQDIIDIITKYCPGERVEGLTALMNSDIGERFMEAPASSKTGFHCCYNGGLVEHSHRVWQNIMAEQKAKGTNYGMDTLLICGLFHDLGKSGNVSHRLYTPNITKSGELHKSQPYRISKIFPGLPHEMRSVVLLSQFIELTDEETQAISYHAWLYGDIGTREIRAWNVEPLAWLLHAADMWATFTEKQDAQKEKIA